MEIFRRQLKRWRLGAVRAGLVGGAVAVKAFFGAAGGSVLGGQMGMDVPALSVQQTAFVFAFGFAYEFFDYLSANPLPDLPL